MKDPTMQEVISELLAEGSQEQHILEGFATIGYNLFIVKVQRSINPPDGEWLVYDEEHKILDTFLLEPDDEVRKEMEQSNVYKQYFWAWLKDDDLTLLPGAPCNQERSW